MAAMKSGLQKMGMIGALSYVSIYKSSTITRQDERYLGYKEYKANSLFYRVKNC